MRKTKIIVTFILTLLVVILVGQNTELMVTRFLFWNLHLSRSLTLLLVFLAGGLAGSLLTMYLRRRKLKAVAGTDKEAG